MERVLADFAEVGVLSGVREVDGKGRRLVVVEKRCPLAAMAKLCWTSPPLVTVKTTVPAGRWWSRAGRSVTHLHRHVRRDSRGLRRDGPGERKSRDGGTHDGEQSKTRERNDASIEPLFVSKRR